MEKYIPYKPLNDQWGVCRTLKYQYQKNSISNFISKGSYGATAVIRKKNNSDRKNGSHERRNI